ncbi:sucrose nonfermenting 4-like protein, partial [Tanacetum coccineum]
TSVLCRSKERRTTTTFSMEVFDNELVPSSVPQIAPIIRVANEFQSRRPRVAFLCRQYALEIANSLDESSSGLGVPQFKTAMIQRLQRGEADRASLKAFFDVVHHVFEKLEKEVPDDIIALVKEVEANAPYNILPLNYGTVNTVFLTREPDYNPAVLSPHINSGSSMDVDNEAFQRVAGPDENLKDITLKILQNRVATLPITHSTSDDGSYPQYFRHSASSLPILQLPICSLPLGTWVPKIGESNRQPLAILRPNSSLSAALNLFVQAEVSSIPIVDDNDSLDVYSRRTVMGGVPGTASDIFAAVKDVGANVIMISQGSGEHSVCFAVPEKEVEAVATALEARFQQALSAGHLSQFSTTIHLLRGVDLSKWKELQEKGEKADMEKFVQHVQGNHFIPNMVLVDCTSSTEYLKLRAFQRQSFTHYFYEATVGAGLPIMHTLRDLFQTGDKIIKIEGIFRDTKSTREGLMRKRNGESMFWPEVAGRGRYLERDPDTSIG